MKVLIVKLSSIGDVVHAIAFVNRLKEAAPAIEVDWLVNDIYSGLVKNVRGVRRVWHFRRAAWGKEWHRPQTWGEIATLMNWLRREKYDICLDLQGLLRSGVVTALSGATVRAGFANAREGSRFLYNTKVDPGPRPHAVEVLFQALPLFGVAPPARPDFTFAIPDQSRVQMEHMLKELGINGPFLIFHAGARWKTKMWPAAHWSRLAEEVRAQSGLPVLFTGSAGDAPLIHQILGGREGLFNVAGGLGLVESAALIARSALMVTVDSGPMHIAAAFDRPIVALFGPTAPHKTGPVSRAPVDIIQTRHPCVPCFSRACKRKHECMEEITPEEVAYKTLRMLSHLRLVK